MISFIAGFHWRILWIHPFRFFFAWVSPAPNEPPTGSPRLPFRETSKPGPREPPAELGPSFQSLTGAFYSDYAAEMRSIAGALKLSLGEVAPLDEPEGVARTRECVFFHGLEEPP